MTQNNTETRAYIPGYLQNKQTFPFVFLTERNMNVWSLSSTLSAPSLLLHSSGLRSQAAVMQRRRRSSIKEVSVERALRSQVTATETHSTLDSSVCVCVCVCVLRAAASIVITSREDTETSGTGLWGRKINSYRVNQAEPENIMC